MKVKFNKDYKVIINDCCVIGEFVSSIVEMVNRDEEEVNEFEYGVKIKFKNGVVLEHLNGVELKEV